MTDTSSETVSALADHCIRGGIANADRALVADTLRALTAERDALRDGLEAACDVQNWIEDNVPDDLFERVPTEPWNRITEAVIIARANNPTSRNETAV